MGSRARERNRKCLILGSFMRLLQYVYKPKKRTVKGHRRTYHPPQLPRKAMMGDR